MLKIDWKYEEDMPFCSEEHIFNKIKNHLVISCGFNRSRRGKYRYNGFNDMTCVYNLETKKWKKIGKFPGGKRQGARSVVVNDEMYCWGGWKYNPMNKELLKKVSRDKWPVKRGCVTFSNGYKLSYDEKTDIWKWTKLINLPYSSTNSCLSSDKNKIYLCTGSVCDPKYGQLSTDIDNVGNRLFVLDTSKNDMKWEELKPFPGKQRMNAVSFIYKKHLYVLGGIYSNSTWSYGDISDYHRFMSILDNWKYDIKNDTWTRLSDNPYYMTGFSSSDNILYNGKAVLYGSSYRLSSIVDGKMIENNLVKVVNIDVNKKNYLYGKFKTCGLIITYDIENDKFEKLNSTYVANINLPMYQIYGNKIYSTGGEIPTCESNKRCKATHLEVFTIGTLS